MAVVSRGEIYFHFNVCMEQNLFIYNTILSNILEVSLNFKMMKKKIIIISKYFRFHRINKRVGMGRSFVKFKTCICKIFKGSPENVFYLNMRIITLARMMILASMKSLSQCNIRIYFFNPCIF
ncbi:unnamed protein product [Lepeophtheirus salmonis]|uniref:(salmon louse) hypothetical protein n=1 Tax=Lepeophtheirus salmonis TaxID=72036 RepID=A0A7R8H2X5_LEPSM|nr:unnamed protein product [Lepeophtheirus salmonis]CAF2822590.1 unnamed protein product [Lepeophtheirus salmonis]